jgi:hypothetical protein
LITFVVLAGRTSTPVLSKSFETNGLGLKMLVKLTVPADVQKLKEYVARLTSSPPTTLVLECLQKGYPTLYDHVHNPPRHVHVMYTQLISDEEEGWVITGSLKGSAANLWSFWKSGSDLVTLEQLHSLQGDCDDFPSPSALGILQSFSHSFEHLDPYLSSLFQQDDKSSFTQAANDKLHPIESEALLDPQLFLDVFNLPHLPAIPTSARELEELLYADVWELSKAERLVVAQYIEDQVNHAIDDDTIPKLKELSEHYKKIRATWDQAKENVRAEP